jgi:hypothetical protein
MSCLFSFCKITVMVPWNVHRYFTCLASGIFGMTSRTLSRLQSYRGCGNCSPGATIKESSVAWREWPDLVVQSRTVSRKRLTVILSHYSVSFAFAIPLYDQGNASVVKRKAQERPSAASPRFSCQNSPPDRKQPPTLSLTRSTCPPVHQPTRPSDHPAPAQ